ncbi:hypothetical protein MP638_005801 [Amoeboaphelidium occidentale]|nr:hypothetical protein MP638_005801 [Amoeboaphelidium occidentale]
MSYYEVLEIERSASENDIKRSYRKLSLKYHPDKHPPETREFAELEFKKISEAYQVLMDPEKRQLYDRFGEEGLRRQMSGNGERPASDNSGFRSTSSFQRHTFNQHTDPFASFFFRSPREVFRDFFGGRDPFTDSFFNDPFANDPFFRDHQTMFHQTGMFGHRSMFHPIGFPTMPTLMGSYGSSAQSVTREINGQRTTVQTIQDSHGNITTRITKPDGTIEVIQNGTHQSITYSNSSSGSNDTSVPVRIHRRPQQ